jgi:hypothetical protein
LDDATLTAAGTAVLDVTGTLVTVLADAELLSVGTEAFTGTLTVTLDDAVLLAAAFTGIPVDITVTGTFDPRRWAATLPARVKTGQLDPRDDTGVLTARDKTGTLDSRRWKATL